MSVVELNDAPRKIRDMHNKALAALERNNADYAIDLCLELLKLEPALLESRKLLRMAQMKKAKDKKPGFSMSSLKTGKVKKLIEKDPLKALQAAEELMKTNPLNLAFIDLVVEAAEAADLKEAAVETMEIAKEHFSRDTVFLKKLAALYSRVSHTSGAKEIYETIHMLKPGDQNALKDFKDASAVATMDKGNWDTKKDYRDILVDEDKATQLEQEARAKKSDSDVTGLLDEMKEKIASEPGNINFVRRLADLYSQNGDYDESLETYEKANELSGGADPQIEKAINKVKVQIFDHNINYYESEGDEENAAEMRADKEAFLIEDAAERVKRYPNDLNFKFEYGELLFNRDELNEAIQQFQQSQRNPQKRLESLYYLGRCFKAKGQNDMAIDQLKVAAAEIPTMDRTKMGIIYELGTISEEMNNIDQALEYYKQVYAVDIGYKNVSSKIDRAYELKSSAESGEA